MTTDQVFGYTGELNDDPDIYHILSEATAGDNFHGYKQVWLTTGGNNPSYPEELGGDNPVLSGDWETFVPDQGYDKIELKNAFFDTSIETFSASPGLLSGQDDSFMFMKDSQGYTWFYGTIFQQAVIPDGLFPGEDPYLAAASESLLPGQVSMLVNDKDQYEVFPAFNDGGEKITYYFIEDRWGNEYIAQGANTSDVNSAEPGSAEALADLFNSSVLPEGWSKSSRELESDFVLEAAIGEETTDYVERKYNAISDHNGILYYQTAWSTSGKLPATKIDGMPAWNNNDDGRLVGSKKSDDLHGARGDDFLKGRKGDDFMYGNNGNDTLKGGKGDDIISGGQGSDVLAGGLGQNAFGDERDGFVDLIKIKMDLNSPDQIMNLDEIDRLSIKPLEGFVDATVSVSSVDIANMGDVAQVELDGQVVAYYTGGNISNRTLLSMISLA